MNGTGYFFLWSSIRSIKPTDKPDIAQDVSPFYDLSESNNDCAGKASIK